MIPSSQKQALLDWYRANRRNLPWRLNRDPYRVWVSETMLQQTTTQAVVPFFERFMLRFPTVESLASAPVEDVLEMWSGLGYYSRARNLHRAAQILTEEFPSTYQELLDLPGFGPYTARAVASLAFGQPCGVLDGNVIRFLSRFHDLASEWWRPKIRAEFQALSDSWVSGCPSEDMNQAMMELGAMICAPKSPACTLCPLQAQCGARKHGRVGERPLQRPRRAREIWLWEAVVVETRGRVLVCRNSFAPFLKNQWLLPGTAKRAKTAPRRFHFRHSVTHHDIFVTVSRGAGKLKFGDDIEQKWLRPTELRRHVPASLVQKALACRSGVSDELPLREGRKKLARRDTDQSRRSSDHRRRR